MALSEAMSNSPRPSPDWLEAITTCQPAWLSRATASSAPGSGVHSMSLLTKSSRCTLRVPLRSRMTIFMAYRSGGEALELRHAVHRRMQQHQEAQAVEAQVGLVGI